MKKAPSNRSLFYFSARSVRTYTFAMRVTSKLARFQATIYKIWMMRHVDVPEEIGRALAKEHRARAGKGRKPDMPKHIPVIATVNRRTVRTTLVPAGGGRYRLQLNRELRKAAGGADVGDLIGVELQFDPEPREIAVPAELIETLKDHPKARREFDRLPPGHRRQLLLYYLRVKSPQARENRVLKMVDHLLERATLGRPTRGKSRKK